MRAIYSVWTSGTTKITYRYLGHGEVHFKLCHFPVTWFENSWQSLEIRNCFDDGFIAKKSILQHNLQDKLKNQNCDSTMRFIVLNFGSQYIASLLCKRCWHAWFDCAWFYCMRVWSISTARAGVQNTWFLCMSEPVGNYYIRPVIPGTVQNIGVIPVFSFQVLLC